MKKVYAQINQRVNDLYLSPTPYVIMDWVWHKRSWGGTVENSSMLVVVGVIEGTKGDSTSWYSFVSSFPAVHGAFHAKCVRQGQS